MLSNSVNHKLASLVSLRNPLNKHIKFQLLKKIKSCLQSVYGCETWTNSGYAIWLFCLVKN